MLGLIQQQVLDISPTQVIHLSYDPLVQQYDLAVVTVIATSLMFIWNNRVRSLRRDNHYLHTEIFARAKIMSYTTKFGNSATVLFEMLDKFPP